MKCAELAGHLKVLADTSRLQLLSLVYAHPLGLTVSDLTERLGTIAQPTVTHHMQALQSAGFVHRERTGRSVTYRPEVAGLSSVIEDLRRLR